MAETSRDFDQERRLSIVEEAAKEGLYHITPVELDYMVSEIEYYEACMSSSMSMGTVLDHSDACEIFEQAGIPEDRKKTIKAFMDKMLSD